MKKFFLFLAVLSASAVAIATVSSESTLDALTNANVEALAQMELPPSIIVCDTGYCGYCWEAQRFFLLYKCVWTGMQEDYCDCSLIGYV